MSSKKEAFIKIVQAEIFDREDIYVENYPDSVWNDALIYFEALKMDNGKGKGSKQFTENGKLVLQYVKDHKDDYGNLFKAKDIGEGLGISSRTASGAMRKLVTDGYIEKLGENPVVYSLTDKGEQVQIEA